MSRDMTKNSCCRHHCSASVSLVFLFRLMKPALDRNRTRNNNNKKKIIVFLCLSLRDAQITIGSKFVMNQKQTRFKRIDKKKPNQDKEKNKQKQKKSLANEVHYCVCGSDANYSIEIETMLSTVKLMLAYIMHIMRT